MTKKSKRTKPALSVRLATVDDAVTIHAGLLAMARGMGDGEKMVATVQSIIAHGFGEAPAFEVLLAELNGDFAGLCVSFPIYSTWRGEPGVFVQDLYVDEQARGLGLGERLLKEAARRSLTRGARYLRLSVDEANAGARAFYQRLGMTHSRDEQIQVLRGEAFEAFAAVAV